MSNREEIGSAHDALTVGWGQSDLERICKFESLLCAIFGKQWEWGHPKCYSLRKAIVDFYISSRR